jgi:hypothetical protein
MESMNELVDIVVLSRRKELHVLPLARRSVDNLLLR